jgi:hypothetical protein
MADHLGWSKTRRSFSNINGPAFPEFPVDNLSRKDRLPHRDSIPWSYNANGFAENFHPSPNKPPENRRAATVIRDRRSAGSVGSFEKIAHIGDRDIVAIACLV